MPTQNHSSPEAPGIHHALSHPLFKDRLDSLVDGTDFVTFDDVASSATSYMVALTSYAITQSTKAPTSPPRVWITHPNPRVRDRIATEILLWGCQPILLPSLPESALPSATSKKKKNSSDTSEITADPKTIATRLGVMNTLSRPAPTGSLQVVILCPDSLSDAAPTPDSLKSGKLNLHLGDTINPESLENQLLKNGYEHVMQVHAHGQFTRRGGILDVFPWQAQSPLRIEFFDTEIDSLRIFDIDSQITIRRIQESEILLSNATDEGTLRDYLLPSDRLLAAGVELEVANKTNQSPLPSPCHGMITENVGFFSANDSPITSPPPNHQSTTCLGSPLGVFEPGDFILNEARRQRFFDQISDWHREGYHIYLTFSNQGEKDRFDELVDSNFFKAHAITNLYGELVQGFTIPSAHLAFISSAELFGRYQTPQTRRSSQLSDVQSRAQAQTALEDIEDDDLVVHAEYGIGRFLGIELNEEGHEEIHIEYFDGATLSVPLNHSHLLSKYIGLGGKTPSLSKLGSNSWSKARSSAEKSILDYAAKLLQLQAERNTTKGYQHPPDSRWVWEFENSFHHELTPGQQDCIEDTKADMESTKPMDRLICGDVGFGKTEVAIRAAFKAITGGKQVALLCPTTVLAEQHWRTFRERMSDYPIRIELLNRFRKASEVRETLKGLSEGSVDMVVGTHRLISKDVQYKDLGLAIIDEEQRFGVKHKERFKEMFRDIDVLTLSATPIPRTLYLSLMGARDMSTIDTPIPGKTPINTSIHGYDERIIRSAIERELKRGGQVFFLHNRVKSIELMRQKLQALVPEASIVVGHGQMEKDELEVVMRTFVQGKADILLATTIIESGIDIPNANTIIIDRADRFGLADLYQLRGRVGRAGGQAYALLLLPRDLIHSDARKRINAIKQYTALGSGFKIAMRDLEIRGAGNLLGTKQSGHITAVGFDLYCQLLKQSIDRLKGGQSAQRVDVSLRADFLVFNEGEYARSSDTENLPAYIPSNYMPEARLRISGYKELAELVSQKELRALEKRWVDRFGKPPSPVANLLLATELKITAHTRGISAISIEGQRVKIMRNNQLLYVGNKRFPRLRETSPLKKLKETIKMIQSF